MIRSDMRFAGSAARALIAFAVLCCLPNSIVAQQEIEGRLATIRERLAAVTDRSAALNDLNDIENLQRSFGFYFDKMLWDHVADLFADDGSIELGFSGVYIGRERIREYLYSLSGGRQGPLEGVLYNHLQLQPIVTVSDDRQSAQGRWRALVLTGVSGSGSGGNWGAGPYKTSYIRENGVWKIQSLRWYGKFLAPYEGGWIDVDEAALRAHTVSPTLVPDAPPSADYEPFPAATVVPFHFANPGR